MTNNTALYRFYNEQDQLLYVGISNNIANRFNQHSQNAEWHGLASRATIERFDTRADALIAEKSAIQSEYPQFNKIHSFKYEPPVKHFQRLFDSSIKFPDTYHQELVVKMNSLLNDSWIINLDTGITKGWAFCNAVWELSKSEDDTDVPCNSCMVLAEQVFIEDAHAAVCEIFYTGEAN